MCNNGCMLEMSVKHIHTTDPSACWIGFVFCWWWWSIGWLCFPTQKVYERLIGTHKELQPVWNSYHFLQIQWTVQGWVLSKGWPNAGDRISSVLWCMDLMHDFWSRHAIMQIVSTHWTSTMFGIGLSKSSSAWKNLIVFPHPSPNHVKPMWRRCGLCQRNWQLNDMG